MLDDPIVFLFDVVVLFGGFGLLYRYCQKCYTSEETKRVNAVRNAKIAEDNARHRNRLEEVRISRQIKQEEDGEGWKN